MAKARYSDKQIGKAFERYYQRIDRVTEVLKLAPLNQNGIYTIANISQDFQVITSIRQSSTGGILIGTIEDKIAVCRELILSKNPKMARDETLHHVFAQIPLDVQTEPFFFAAYDNPTFDYVIKHARTEQEFEKGRVMYSEKRVPFLLAKEVDINQTFPFRVRLGNISALVKRKK